MDHLLKYKTEADSFEEALPIGNGRLGAMIYGRVGCEKISLNDDTVWSGTGSKNPVPENAYESYMKARQLVLEDKICEAQDEIADGFLAMWSQVYLPVGNLYLDFGHKDASDYCRTLDIENAVCKTEYKSGGVTYNREVFASYPDDVIVIRLSTDKAGALNFLVSFDTKLKETEKKFESGNYISVLQCPSNGCIYPFVCKEPFSYTNKKGIAVTAAVKIESDGLSSETENGVSVKNASVAVLYVSIKSSFNGWDKDPAIYGLDHYNNALCVLKNLDLDGYDRIKTAHINDYSSLYGRVCFDLNSSSTQDTLTRLKNFDGSDLALYELIFGYGRYLTIASSRKGTQATTLQGIWNEKYPAPWSSNYTLNINTEMNYWPTLSTNLEECYEPFLSLGKKLRESGMQTARDYYHARGFVSHHNSDLWAMTNPVGFKRGNTACVYSFWNMSSAWISCQLFDLYEYTLDKNKLEEIYPIIQDATLFCTDIMCKDEEGYMICPATSPENHYLRKDAPGGCNAADMNDTNEFSANINADGGAVLSVSKTSTMTVCIFKELLVRYLKASQILGIDNELTRKASEILPDLYPIKITSDGRIMEWAYEETEAELNHRHLSHLYSLYPGNQITVKDTPELAEACRKSLMVRGDESTGWSLAWKINLWAYLKDGNHALKLLNRLMRLAEPTEDISLSGDGGGTYPNMLDSLPPFQIDGNFGAVAAVCNMLMQSEVGYIELLPALPDRWENGSVSGIIAKGNVEIKMKWENKKIVSLMLKSPNSQIVDVCYNNKTEKAELCPGVECTLL